MGVGNASAMMNNFSRLFAQGVQMNQNQNNMDRQFQMQEEKMQMLQSQQQDVAKRLFRDDWNKALFEGDMYGDWNRVSQFMKSHPEEFGDQHLRGSSDSDVYKGDLESGIAKARAQYKADTGITLPDDDEAALKILKSSAVLEDSNGTQWVNPAQLSQGLSNYNSYKTDRIKDMTPSTDEITELGNLHVKATTPGYIMTKAEQSKYDILKNKNKMVTPYAQDVIESGMYDEDMKAISGKEWSTKGFTDDKIRQAVRTQNDAGYHYKGEQAIVDKIDLATSFGNLSSELQALPPVAQGEVQQGLQAIIGRASKEDWDKMDVSQRKKAINTVIKNTKVGVVAQAYLNKMSGTAFSDEEYSRNLKNLFGGDPENMNINTISTALGAAGQTIRDQAQTSIQSIANQYPGTKMSLAKRLNDMYTQPTVDAGDDSTTEINPKTNKPYTPAEIAATVPKQQYEEFKSNVKQAINTFTNDDSQGNQDNQDDSTWYGNAWDSIKNGVKEMLPPTVVNDMKSKNITPVAVKKSMTYDGVTPDNIHTPESQTKIQINDSAQKSNIISQYTESLRGKTLKELEQIVADDSVPLWKKTKAAQVAYDSFGDM